jgi:predicted amidohydrolase
MRPVKIAVIQMSLREGDVEGNTAKALSFLEQAGGAGVTLAVLPEMWWTGFSYRRLPDFADGTPGSLRAVGGVARRHGMAVVGSWPEKEGDRIYNTAYVIGSDGSVRGSYRKAHLFSPMKEDVFLTSGDSLTVVKMEFGALGVLLCYDLRFPEFVRRLALDGAELIVVPSQWPEARIDHFWTLLRARAIENQLFVAGANRAGTGGKVRFGGHSGVINPRGESSGECGSDECVAMADIDLDEVAKVREEICYLDDRVPAVDDIVSR